MLKRQQKQNKPVPKAPAACRPTKKDKSAYKKEKERYMAYITSQVMVSYIGLMDDAAIQVIEKMHEIFSKEKIYTNDPKFKADLDLLLEEAHKMDERLANVATGDEAQFYLDFRDGGMEYLTPTLNDVYEGFNVIAHCTGTLRTHLAAQLMTCYTLVKHSVKSGQHIIAQLEKKTHCTISGADTFMLNDALLILSRMCDTYLKPIPQVLEPSVEAIKKNIYDHTTPDTLIVAAAEYAKKYADPERGEAFKARLRKIFKHQI